MNMIYNVWEFDFISIWSLVVISKVPFFTPQPSGLEGYCRHGSGGRAVGRAAAKFAEPISL